jgi:hypothetical protein
MALSSCLKTDQSLALIEVPDGSAIPDLLNVYEFWDEHLFCFSKNNLIKMLHNAGLRVTETQIQPHLDTRNLIAWCEKVETKPGTDLSPADRDCVALWQSLPERWESFKSKFTEALQSAQKPVYAIGASHSQTNLINFLGAGGLVDFFIDDDISKVGLYPPVKDCDAPIISSATFETAATAGTLLQTGFGYEKWSDKLTKHALSRGMLILNPKDFIAYEQDH